MKNLLGVLVAGALVSTFGAGCADVDPTVDSSADSVDQVTDYAPTSAVKAEKKKAMELSALSEKGVVSRTFGYTHIETYLVKAGATVTYRTAPNPNYNGTDTMIALFMRHDNGNVLIKPAVPPSNPGEEKARIGLRTLKIDDDSSPYDWPYSEAKWTNNLGYDVNIFCAVFNYYGMPSNPSSAVDLYRDNVLVGSAISVRAGSAVVNTTAGRIWSSNSVPGTASYVDPVLIGLDMQENSTDSALNDDDADNSPGGYESDINGFRVSTPSAPRPVLVIAHSGFERAMGQTRINY